jgi:hypothetical protein
LISANTPFFLEPYVNTIQLKRVDECEEKMNNHLNLEDAAASSLVEEGLIPEKTDIDVLIWPGHDHRDLKVLDNLPEVRQVVATSPAYVGINDQYSSDTLIRGSKTSHELAEEFHEEYGEGVFDFEYGHAVMEDFTESEVLGSEEKIEKIRRLGETSNKALKDDGRAVYNLNSMSHGIVNEHKGEDFSLGDYQKGHGALFQDVLEKEYFKEVSWTDELGGDNYHSDTVFVIADNPILKTE